MTTLEETNPLKHYRGESLLSQRELAEKAGVSEATVFKIEHGQKARGRTLRKLAEALDIEAKKLAGLKGDK